MPLIVDIEKDTDSFFIFKDENDKKVKIEDLIYNYPLPLLSIYSKSSLIDEGLDNYLPYSVGIEFECFKKDNYSIKAFKDIPYIMDVSIDVNEQRYRIPSGLKGLVCLYTLCNTLKEYSSIDLSSSNHYHSDMVDVWEELPQEKSKFEFNYIIEELKKWETAKNLSKAFYGQWYKFNDLKTLEIRIGEPSFEYSVIVKRIIDCARITKYLKTILLNSNEEGRLSRLQSQLDSLKEDKTVEEQKDIKSIINNRSIKLNDNEHNNR